MIHKLQALKWNKLNEMCVIDMNPNDIDMNDIFEVTHVKFNWHRP
jgi:hypothetical protein